MAESGKEMEGRGIEASPSSPLQGASEGSAAGKKPQLMGLVRQLSRRDSMNSPGNRDDRGWTPLHVAARRGDLNEVRGTRLALQTEGAAKKYAAPRDEFESVLTKVQRLIDEGADVNVSSTGPKAAGATPLHLAATGGHIDVMDELLERGANIEVRTKGGCGWTPLHNAAKEKNRKAVRFLLENGAFLPPDMTDGRFNPPLHYCPGLHWAYKQRNKLLAEAQQTKHEEDAETWDDM